MRAHTRRVGRGQVGSVPAPAASRARGFNPGHAPHHRGIGVTPPGLGREKPWGIWGAGTRCRSELLPTPTHKRRLRGSGGNAFGSSRRPRLSLPRELGVVFPRTVEASRMQPQPRGASCQNSRTLLAVFSYRTRCTGQTRLLKTAKEQPDAFPQWLTSPTSAQYPADECPGPALRF